jgi:ABC-2 type transport system ATP-binding protein
MNAIEVRELVKKFGEFTAVDRVSFSVEHGEIFGFLGPNGAGKTTTINMLCTLLKPTAGTALVNGYDVVRHPYEVRQSIGLVFQDPSLDDQLTAEENLRFHAMLYGVSRRDYEQRRREVLELVGLSDRAQSLVRTFSGGMKRRLEIARGLLHHPRVLFLDEPTLGLDPQTRHHIWDYVRALRDREQITIFLTTHYLEEAEYADRIAIMDHGQIVALDTPEGLKRRVGGDVVRLHTSDNQQAVLRLRHALQTDVLLDSNEIVLRVPQGDQTIPQIMRALGTPPAIDVLSINLRRPTLDDVFVHLTGKAIRDTEASTTERLRQMGRIHGRAR